MVKSSKAIYSSKILKAGSILAETKILLADWDNSASVNQNLDRFRQSNILGKASRSRVEDILQVSRQRYLAEEQVTKALVSLVKSRYSAR